ncbi:glycosyltransferase family 4 protein [Arthrobacter sp. ISL-69]|uniref:glycosyltransferase family 4 protein n=1 Tax=Arthrobacter sp. ISL-69 TaxID=2819113 RepID=UPI001BE61A3C|nr:glycosyltransferase family 4 protein [Arthrobacter sp. ISL-69]MBT2538864.1 glycosyltransferase family 4 protein [Arthrobacter sp. ISL-69]
MRIGLIAPPWIQVPPPSYGGIEAVVDVLARGLTAAGHEVLLAAAAGSTCPVRQVPGVAAGDPGRTGLCADELRHVVFAYEAMHGVDIVHDHTLAGPLYRHRPTNTPLVATAHGPLAGAAQGFYQAMTADCSLIAISHHQANSAPGVRISRVIHHGIDTAEVPVGQGEGGYTCFLGRMHPDKGLLQAIRAARLARMPLRIGAKMCSRDEHEYFRAVIEPLLGPDVEFLGELNTAEKYALLGGAVALLNPIQWPEPFGMVMIEALAAGTPVVATRRGSAPEIIDDGATGFLGSGLREVAAALTMAGRLDRRACRRAAETRFSSRRMVSEHLQLYKEVIIGSPAPTPFAAATKESAAPL